jgi:hypothetical protein
MFSHRKQKTKEQLFDDVYDAMRITLRALIADGQSPANIYVESLMNNSTPFLGALRLKGYQPIEVDDRVGFYSLETPFYHYRGHRRDKVVCPTNTLIDRLCAEFPKLVVRARKDKRNQRKQDARMYARLKRDGKAY